MGESPTYLGLKELPIMDQIPTEALHILAEGGGGGVEVYFDWCIIASSWLNRVCISKVADLLWESAD